MSKYNINITLEKIFEEHKKGTIETKAAVQQIRNLFNKRTTDVHVRCFKDNTVLVNNIIIKNNSSNGIKYDYRVFEYLKDHKEDIMNWISKFESYKIKEDDSTKDAISSFMIFGVEINIKNPTQLVVKIDANQLDTFDHGIINPFFLRIMFFIKLMKNIDVICYKIGRYYKTDEIED